MTNFKENDVVKLIDIDNLPEEAKIDLIAFPNEIMGTYKKWSGRLMTVTVDGTDYISVKENSRIWKKTWFERAQSIRIKGKEMTKMEKVIKNIRTTVALGQKLNNYEQQLINMAGNELIDNLFESEIDVKSWDIKFQSAFQKIRNEDYSINAAAYFDVVSCDLENYHQYDWIKNEIFDMMLDLASGKSAETNRILYLSNQLSIAVNVEHQKLMMIRSIYRDGVKLESISHTVNYGYRQLDIDETLGAKLLMASS